ncbi:helix-turn-helix transcriptional regulator [Allohahella marinimesophila]|uniref:HTH cro/C1-type domain-containing protein n=1 Tax=Allohahella marinimesophila TaxID=1054972 RepID=A0ABP7PZ21_9GAMM
MRALLAAIKRRREALGLRQADMYLRVGISRQQYQRLESQGNPRLDTLELIAKGLNSSVLLIPDEHLDAVRAVLEKRARETSQVAEATPSLADDPWQGLLGDDT